MGKFGSVSVAVGMGVILLAGCSKKEEPVALPVEEVPQVMQEAFKQAEPQVSQEVTRVIGSVREQDPRALSELQNLSDRNDLTAEQRLAADRAKFALLQRLQEAAQKGDQRAEDELNKFRARK